ncbi:MAG: hypothetical protein JSV17_06640 [Candidatus Aminicenantes bacterium]|nr:MAG: hypothetical protein JSV17_06640 [Candidatus Aminicenantes bacterium]
MKVNSFIKRWNFLLLWVLRLMLVCFVLAVMMGIKFPFAPGEKSNFIALIHMGVAVGIGSNWRFIIGLNWKDPINIIGTILGIAATLVIVYALKDMKMPFISGFTAAFQVLAVLLILKIGLKIIQDRKEKQS